MRSAGTADFIRFSAEGEDHNRPFKAYRNTGFDRGSDAGRRQRSWSPGPAQLTSNPVAILLTQIIPSEAANRREVSNPA